LDIYWDEGVFWQRSPGSVRVNGRTVNIGTKVLSSEETFVHVPCGFTSDEDRFFIHRPGEAQLVDEVQDLLNPTL